MLRVYFFFQFLNVEPSTSSRCAHALWHLNGEETEKCYLLHDVSRWFIVLYQQQHTFLMKTEM